MQRFKREHEWFESRFKPYITLGFSVVEINEKDGDLGDLLGFQFDSDEIGGYIYFWSFGFVGFQLVDYLNGVELVCDSIRAVGVDSYDNLLREMILAVQ